MPKMEYWQVAAGSDGRDYSHDFLRCGVACVGGDVQEATMAKVKPGDRLLLKRGQSEVVAVGEAIERDGVCNDHGGKTWLDCFDGWRLPAYCHVRWHLPTQPIPTKGLTRTTIERVHTPELRAAAETVLASAPAYASEELIETPTIDDDQMVSFLISEGLRPASAEDLLVALRRIRLLATYYYDFAWGDVREHETRTFLVMPLLLALGWAEQQIKIELGASERRKIDIACFSKPYRRGSQDCKLLIETKGFTSGLSYAPDQARAYAKDFPETHALVVTNGYCYKTYIKDESGEFSQIPHAYLDLLKPLAAYPLNPTRVKGALEVLRLMMPR